MKLQKLLSLTLVAACFTFTACSDDGGDESTDSNADMDTTTGGDGDGDGDETGPSGDATCATYCVAFLTLCVETGQSSDFASDAECQMTCEGWAQADLQCRQDAVDNSMCAEAGVDSPTCN